MALKKKETEQGTDHETRVTWNVLEGDSLAVLRDIPHGSVDSVVTDPPYNSGGLSSRTSDSARSKYVRGDAKHALKDFDGDARDQRSYTMWMSLLLGECYRVTRVGGPLLVFCDWRQLPATSDALQIAGWTWRGIVPWHKPISRPSKGGFNRACEYVLWATRGPVDAARNPVYLPGLFSSSQPRGSKRRHITQKPDELMRGLIEICAPAGTVLDPFTGSGSTGVAAVTTGRSFIGIEQSPHYAGISRERLTAAEESLNGA